MTTLQNLSKMALALLVLTSALVQAEDSGSSNFNVTDPFELSGLKLLRGLVCVSGIIQPGGAGTAITTVNVTPLAGGSFSATGGTVTSTALPATALPAGTVGLSINIPVIIGLLAPSVGIPVNLLTIQNSFTANTVSGTTYIQSVNASVTNVTNFGFTANVNLVVIDTTTAGIWNLVSAWLLTSPTNQLCYNFEVLAH